MKDLLPDSQSSIHFLFHPPFVHEVHVRCHYALTLVNRSKTKPLNEPLQLPFFTGGKTKVVVHVENFLSILFYDMIVTI